jgi:hypothetical protein
MIAGIWPGHCGKIEPMNLRSAAGSAHCSTPWCHARMHQQRKDACALWCAQLQKHVASSVARSGLGDCASGISQHVNVGALGRATWKRCHFSAVPLIDTRQAQLLAVCTDASSVNMAIARLGHAGLELTPTAVCVRLLHSTNARLPFAFYRESRLRHWVGAVTQSHWCTVQSRHEMPSYRTQHRQLHAPHRLSKISHPDISVMCRSSSSLRRL